MGDLLILLGQITLFGQKHGIDPPKAGEPTTGLV